VHVASAVYLFMLKSSNNLKWKCLASHDWTQWNHSRWTRHRPIFLSVMNDLFNLSLDSTFLAPNTLHLHFNKKQTDTHLVQYYYVKIKFYSCDWPRQKKYWLRPWFFFVIKSRMVLFNTWQCLEISITFAKKHKYLLIEGGTFRDILKSRHFKL